jgi:hypothetical protein
MQQQQLNKKGFVTLFSLIILMIVSISVFTSILLVNADSLSSVQATRQGIVARSLANSCMEIALNELKSDQAYAGGATFTFAQGSCQIVSISGSGNSNRIIRVSGNADGFIRKAEALVLTINPSTSISYWQEKDF